MGIQFDRKKKTRIKFEKKNNLKNERKQNK